MADGIAIGNGNGGRGVGLRVSTFGDGFHGLEPILQVGEVVALGDDDEFVTADTVDFGMDEDPADGSGGKGDVLVAGFVAEVVVGVLEFVDIDHDEGEFRIAVSNLFF